MRALIASRHVPVVLLAAPSGYGKSVLLCEWANVDERPFAWLTLEAHHNDAARLIAAISQALETSGRLRASDPSLSGVVRDLERQPGPIVLALDDVDLLESRAALEVLEAIAVRLPAGSQLALASRLRPRLRLGRLQARRQLFEMHASDLAMNESEAAMLLEACGLVLEPAQTGALMARVEGWPAAVYLAGLSLRESDGTDATADRAVEESCTLSDFLREEVIERLPTESATFIRLASPLETLSGDLCDAALNRSDSAVMLRELSHTHLLLAELERPEGTYRCHPALRQTLRQELDQLEPEQARRVHRRACGWFRSHGQADRALGHALAGRHARQAGDLLWSRLPGLAHHGHEQALSEVERTFTVAEIESDPALSLFMAHVHLGSGELALASDWGAAAAVKLGRPRPAAQVASLQAGLLLLDAAIARDGIVRMARDASRAYELETDRSPWRALCRLYQGVASHLTGDRARACVLLEDGARRATAFAPNVHVLCLAQLAGLAVEANDWELARERCEEALAVTERAHVAEDPAAALMFAVSALVCAQTASVDDAKKHLRQATRLLAAADGCTAWYVEETCVLTARAAARLTDMNSARTLLARASRAGRRVADAPILRAWLEQALGELDACPADALDGSSSLTLAELRILRFLPTHLSFREIGDRLHVSTNTVKSQAHAVYRKLDASSRSEAVARAAQVGLVWRTPGPPDGNVAVLP